MASKPTHDPTPGPSPNAAAALPGARVRGRKRRIARWCIRVIVGIPLLLIATSLLLANSPWVASTVREQLSVATGCTVELERARIELDGRILIAGLKLRVPGMDGPEGQLLAAERAEVDLTWSAALSWSGLSAVRPRSIRLTKPVFRLSQSLDDGSLNIAGLAAAGPGSGSGAGGPAVGAVPAIPTVNVQDGQIEFAEHSTKQQRFEPLNTIHVAGIFSTNQDGSYRLRMQEIGRLPPPQIAGEPQLPRGMILDGRIDLQRAEAMLRLLNVPLEAWPPESVPTAFRETWRRLRIQGRIRETMFTYDRTEGVKLSVWPERVSMDIPVPEEEAGSADDLSLSGVNGVVTFSAAGLSAELEGVFEDQTKPLHVKLRTEGAGTGAPLVCEIWGEGLTLARNPGFLPYIPPTAREFFVFFSGPTGEVDARVTIARGPPVNGEPAPVVVTDGRLNVRNGTAAFHLFPYPFHNMEVKATFDENHLNLLDIRGDGPTGAKLRASSQAAPMTDDARVDVSVHVANAPIDEHLRAAMPGSRKQLLDVLFNEERYAELLAAGLVRDPRATDAAGAEGAPLFALGGTCEIDVTVLRPFGPDVEWSTEVVVRIPEAGIVPKPFPFPILARDVGIRITDTEGTLTHGTFAGLRGGRAELSAHVLLEEDGRSVLKPRLEIAAFDVPVDDLLIHAVPDDESAAEPGAVSAKAILRRLDIRGNVDCSASIRDADDGTEDVDYDVAVNLKDIEARPRLADGAALSRLVVSNATGRIAVRPDLVRVEELTGRLVAEDPVTADGPDAVVDSAGTFTLGLDAQIIEAPEAPEIGPPAPSPVGAVSVDVRAEGVDLAAPLPTLLGVFNEEIAAELARIRDRRAPAGRIDADLQLRRAAGAARPSVAAKFTRFDDVSFAAMSNRVCLVDAVGAASFADRDDPDPRRRTAFVFDGFAAGVEYAGAPGGTVELDGRFSVNPDADEGASLERSLADAELRISLRDADFASPMVRDVMSLGLSAPTLEDWEALGVEGRFDLHAELSGDPVAISGMLGPREVSFVRGGRRVMLPEMVGHLVFATVPDPLGGDDRRIEGRLDQLSCRGGAWSIAANGAWSFARREGFMLDTMLDVEGQSLSEELLGLIPTDAAEALRGVGLRIDGGFSMPEARLVAMIPAAGDADEASPPAELRFDGLARFADAAADIGLPVSGCDGQVAISIAGVGDEPPALAIEFESPSLRVAGLSMTDARALLVSETIPADGGRSSVGDGLAVPYFTADCHEGRIWGSASIGPAAAAGQAETGREFAGSFVAAGVLFAPLLDELGGTNPVPAPPADAADEAARTEPETPHEPEPSEADRARGQADLWVCISGRTGDPASRLGRGALRVANGDVFRLPVVFPLVQMSNLMLPSDDRFEYLQAEFHLRGRTAFFENIALLSDSVSLMGDGTATLPDLALDMRFNSRSNRRVPLLSDMYEALRDEIVTTRVRGTVTQPEIRSETLSTTRSILDSLWDPGREQAGSIGRDTSARREQARVNDALRAEPPLPPTTLPSRPTGVDG